MVKFPSNHTVLEVKRIAQANTSPENKIFNQCILNMHHLMDRHSRNRVFIDLQAKACAEMAYEYDEHAQERLLAEGDNLEEFMRYARRVITKGKKDTGKKFTAEEYQAIKKKMIAARDKVNLRCSVVLMLGVLDEHDVLGPNQVLVGNGLVQGPVLICRSPCTAPGDIQRAYAVSRKSREPFTNLDGVLVFSAQGDRPLPDMLAGGDLDGDEYYVIVSVAGLGFLWIYE